MTADAVCADYDCVLACVDAPSCERTGRMHFGSCRPSAAGGPVYLVDECLQLRTLNVSAYLFVKELRKCAIMMQWTHEEPIG